MVPKCNPTVWASLTSRRNPASGNLKDQNICWHHLDLTDIVYIVATWLLAMESLGHCAWKGNML